MLRIVLLMRMIGIRLVQCVVSWGLLPSDNLTYLPLARVYMALMILWVILYRR